jgi:hypothetical protein
MEEETQAQIDAHNTATLWAEASDNLDDAAHSLERAMGILEDLDVPHISENLKPVVEAVERFRALAKDKA